MGTFLENRKIGATGVVVGLNTNETSVVVFFSGKDNLKQGSSVMSMEHPLTTNFSLEILGKTISAIS